MSSSSSSELSYSDDEDHEEKIERPMLSLEQLLDDKSIDDLFSSLHLSLEKKEEKKNAIEGGQIVSHNP